MKIKKQIKKRKQTNWKSGKNKKEKTNKRKIGKSQYKEKTNKMKI